MPGDRRPHFWLPSERIRVESLTPRGGGDTYVRTDMAQHSAGLMAQFAAAADSVSSTLDAPGSTELFFQISTATTRPIRKERPHLHNIGLEIVSYSAQADNIAIVRLARSHLRTLQHKLHRYANTPRHIGKSNFAAIEQITRVPPAEKIESSLSAEVSAQSVPCLICLYSEVSERQKSSSVERLVQYLRTASTHDVRVQTLANGAVAVAADLTPPAIQHVSEQFMTVRRIEPNSELISETAVETDPLPAVLHVESPRCSASVVVVDSGIHPTCPLFQGLVLDVVDELPRGAVGPHLEHGSFVASRILYGDYVTTAMSMRITPWCPVVDVRVTGRDAVGNRMCQRLDELAAILQRVVPALAPRARVFNLSLGGHPISGSSYSTVARLIDFLSREHQVLFVVSAGNIRAPTAAPYSHYLPPDTRILAPSEALLALTVGSVAKYCEPDCAAEEQQVTPYSRRGPGADDGRKPELAAHGGNVFFTPIGWATSPRIAAYGVGPSGRALAYSIGTSYAAPIIAQYAARLFDAYPNASPNLVRALLCHFARPLEAPPLPSGVNAYDLCGFGEPDIDAALYSAGASATYVFQGRIAANTYQFLPFHVPPGFGPGAPGRLRIRGTVVFDPPVSPDDSVEYSRCRLACLLRKCTEAGLRDERLGAAEEDVLQPWNPLFHFEKSFRRAYAAGEWELRLRLMTRGGLPGDFLQSFAVVVEVLDEAGGLDVAQSILSEHGGIYVPIRLNIAA